MMLAGFRIAMQDALRVRHFQRLDDVRGDAQGLVEGQRTMERRSLEVLHHEVVGPDVMQDADVGMAQRRDGAGLLLEALGVRAPQRLDRNCPAQARIDCLVDLAHPPLTQRGHNLVRAQTGTGNQRHCGGVDYKRQLIAPLAGRRALL